MSKEATKKEETKDDFEKYSETDMPWNIIESYFKGHYLEQLVRHQLESYNMFVNYQIQKTIEMFNPVHIKSEQDYNIKLKKYQLEIFITFTNFQIYRPQIHENNGATKMMFPQEARLRNFTYASPMTIDLNIKYIVRNGENLEHIQILHKVINQVHIGKLPIMLKSSICILKQYNHIKPEITEECKYDAGGYFIINGSEKTVLGQERAAENRVYCFNVSKNNTKWSWIAEIKSVPDFKCISPKQLNIMVSTKNNGFGYGLYIQLPRVKNPVPLLIVFRALGILTDKDICEKIYLGKTDEISKKIQYGLQASIIDANKILTQDDAVTYITTHVMYTPINMDKETGAIKKREFALDIINHDLFPHCYNITQKIYFLGYMSFKLLRASLGYLSPDDRDSYSNKRIDLTGTLLNNLFRNYFNKLVKDLQKQITREINNGSWRSREDYINIINKTNIYKIIKSTTIENGIKRALSTGDFGIKHSANNTKVGVAQVLNRLTYASSLSHSRRISTPIDKSGKLIPPRMLHNASWGFLCPAETPEGQSVGVVKNLSYMTHVTIGSDTEPILKYIENNIIILEDVNTYDLYNKVKVFVNGAWIGITNNPIELYTELKQKKYKGIINIYTSIIFDYKYLEIRVCNDAGRLTRPILKVKNNKCICTREVTNKIAKNELSWDDLLTNQKLEESIIEYIDPDEQNTSMISMKPKDLINNNSSKLKHIYTHCEIHPSTIFGILASCIPFPEHNQSPRNTYQAAMGKQAMGIYVTNFNKRMDKTAYVLNYPMRPLVDTRIMNIIQVNKIPSGSNVIVAIMTHGGFNQEDSLLFNAGSIARGLFQATIYHTEKDEDKKVNGDEEIRGKPDPSKTRGMKFGNYNKINSKGVIPENTLLENRDIIIAKVTPIKENRNDHTKVIKYEDCSKSYRTHEETYIDKNCIARNGDGYNFAKVRVRTVRKPVIGDKFCLTPEHEVLTIEGWKYINTITLKDKVGVLDIENDTIKYENPNECHCFDYNDKMYKLNSQLIDLITTPNHRMWIKKRFGQGSKYKDNYEFQYAKDCFGKRLKYKKNISNYQPNNWIGENYIINEYIDGNNQIRPEKIINMNDWLVFFGIWLAEGWASDGRVSFAANKPRVKNALKSVINNMNYNLNIRPSDTNKWSIGDIQLFNEFKNLSVGAINKYMPEWVWKLNKEQSQLLIQSMMLGDGYISKSNAHLYSTSSVILADDLCKLCVHAGYSSHKRIHNGKEAGTEVYFKRDDRMIISNADNYTVTIIKHKLEPEINHGHRNTQNGQTEEWINYKGNVYCLTVSSGVFLTRLNGKPVWTGNSSRHGQKGTIGLIIPEDDMPFTAEGLKPDIIINPHAIPSRMTIAQLKETLLGKALIELGLYGDGTSFGEFGISDISKELLKLNYESHGNDLLYNGQTGEQIETNIFIGPAFYQRLKHMVNDKQHSRSIGPMVNLTRQPAEGRSRDGGLRFGEMERDAMVSHGASRFTKGRIYDASDKFEVFVCKKCGMIASYNDELHIHLCKMCDNRTDFSYSQIPYSCKLLFQELITMNIAPRIFT
jgi:DNA-directed RNA polymerase II subunit RPB2